MKKRNQILKEQAERLDKLGYSGWAMFENVYDAHFDDAFDFLADEYKIHFDFQTFYKRDPANHAAIIETELHAALKKFCEGLTKEYAAFVRTGYENNYKHWINLQNTDIIELRRKALDYALTMAEEIEEWWPFLNDDYEPPKI